MGSPPTTAGRHRPPWPPPRRHHFSSSSSLRPPHGLSPFAPPCLHPSSSFLLRGRRLGSSPYSGHASTSFALLPLTPPPPPSLGLATCAANSFACSSFFAAYCSILGPTFLSLLALLLAPALRPACCYAHSRCQRSALLLPPSSAFSSSLLPSLGLPPPRPSPLLHALRPCLLLRTAAPRLALPLSVSPIAPPRSSSTLLSLATMLPFDLSLHYLLFSTLRHRHYLPRRTPPLLSLLCCSPCYLLLLARSTLLLLQPQLATASPPAPFLLPFACWLLASLLFASSPPTTFFFLFFYSNAHLLLALLPSFTLPAAALQPRPALPTCCHTQASPPTLLPP